MRVCTIMIKRERENNTKRGTEKENVFYDKKEREREREVDLMDRVQKNKFELVRFFYTQNVGLNK